jgi:hypothetical protein
MEEKDPYHFQEHRRFCKIEVHLVSAEGGPYVQGPPGTFEGRQEGMGSRTEYHREIRRGVDFYEKIPVLPIPLEEALKPFAAGGAVIQYQVRHDLEASADLLDLLPGSEIRIHLVIVDDRKAVVRRVGKKGEYMYTGEAFMKPGEGKIAKCGKGPAAGLLEAVPIGDQYRIGLVHRQSARPPMFRRTYLLPGILHEVEEFWKNLSSLFDPIDKI